MAIVREGGDARGERGRQHDGVEAAAMALFGRTRAIGGEREQCRRVGQFPRPEGDLPIQFGAGEQLALPQRIIAIVDIERRQGVARTGIQRAELGEQHPHRPAIGDDMMDDEDRQMPLVGQPQQREAAQRRRAEIERPQRLRHRARLDGFGRGVRQIDDGEGHRSGRLDMLGRDAVPLCELGPERRMAGQQRVQRVGEALQVDRTLDPEQQRHVVKRRPRHHPVGEPQPFLRERQRQRPRTRIGMDERRPRGIARAEAVEPRGEAGDGRCLEQRADRHGERVTIAQPRRHLRRDQRMAAQPEEVILAPDRRDAQQFREQAGDEDFGRGDGRAAAARLVRGIGQGARIELAVRGQRQRGQRQDRGRDHIVGQAGGDMRGQLRRIDPGIDHDIAEQAEQSARVGAGDHRRLRDRGVAAQHRLDLAGFDAVAADLHLPVDAAEERDLPVLTPCREVAGAIETAVVRFDEPVRGQCRRAEIAGGEARAADVQFADMADADARACRIEDVERIIGQRPADRQRCHRGVEVGGDGIDAGVDARLRRAVDVDDRRAVQTGAQLVCERGGQGFAAEHQPGEAGVRGRSVEHGVEEGRHAVDVGDAVVGEECPEIGGGKGAQVGRDDDRGPAQQRQQQLADRDVEPDRDRREHAVARPDRIVILPRDVQVDERAMRHDHALRNAGRTRGEDDIGRIAGRGRRR